MRTTKLKPTTAVSSTAAAASSSSSSSRRSCSFRAPAPASTLRSASKQPSARRSRAGHRALQVRGIGRERERKRRRVEMRDVARSLVDVVVVASRKSNLSLTALSLFLSLSLSNSLSSSLRHPPTRSSPGTTLARTSTTRGRSSRRRSSARRWRRSRGRPSRSRW